MWVKTTSGVAAGDGDGNSLIIQTNEITLCNHWKKSNFFRNYDDAEQIANLTGGLVLLVREPKELIDN